MRPAGVSWSGGAFAAWLVILLAAGGTGFFLTVITSPGYSDLFESPLGLPSIAVLAVFCGLAGWYVPAVAPYWGLVTAAPYLLGFFPVVEANQPPDDADFSLIGFGTLFVLLIMPWLAGFVTGVVRRNR